MALSGTLVKTTLIKSDGDAFFELFGYKPYMISEISPTHITSVDLIDGEWGYVGSVMIWSYILYGNAIVAKEVIESIDKEKKSVCFKVIDGALMEQYKNFFLIVDVDTNGEENSVTWTLTFEKLNENVEDPNNLLEFCLNVTKDIETQQLKESN